MKLAPLDPTLQERYVNLLLGWHTLEAKLGGEPVVDFELVDVSAYTPQAFNTRYDALMAMRALRKGDGIKRHKHAEQRLGAHEAYIRNLMGERWDFAPYIAATQGFRFDAFSDDELELAKSRMEEALSDLNLKADENLLKSMDGLDTELPEKDVADFYQDVLKRGLESLSPIIGKTVDFKVDVSFTEVDAYWAAWVDGNRDGFRLRFNRTHMKKHYEGHARVLALHEMLGHLTRCRLMKDAVDDGTLPAPFGLTTVHSTEQFQEEGLAQTLPLFLENEDTNNPLVQAHTLHGVYRGMVKNNSIIMLNAGMPVEMCLDEVMRRMPWRNRDKEAHAFASVGTHPLFRSYEFVYGGCANFYSNFAHQLDGEGKKMALRAFYDSWMDADDLVSCRDKILEAQAA